MVLTTLRFYIAGHDQSLGQLIAKHISKAGHEVLSSWLNVPFNPTESHTEAERRAIAKRDTDEVIACDVFVLIASPNMVPGGKFVECGIALALGKRVMVLGRRENMLMWHSAITQYDSLDALLEVLMP